MNNKELNKINIITITVIIIIPSLSLLLIEILFNYTPLTAPVSTQNLLKNIFRNPGFQVW